MGKSIENKVVSLELDDSKFTSRVDGVLRNVDRLKSGMNFKQWDELTPREKMLILNWHDYKAIREAYINWWTLSRNETAESKNPMRYTLPS